MPTLFFQNEWGGREDEFMIKRVKVSLRQVDEFHLIKKNAKNVIFIEKQKK